MLNRMAFIGLLLSAAGANGAEPVIGWRTDGTGLYPKAQPPREWGLSKNVAWSTKMPAGSVASPIIVGDKIFVCAEPCILLCVNKADGKILWTREHSYKDLDISVELQEKINAERKVDDTLKAKQSAFSKQMSDLKKLVAASTVSKDDAEKTADQLKLQVKGIEQQRKLLTLAVLYSDPSKNSVGGFSQCTPVCDGRHVYVGFGNGLVAAYDLAGNRQWLRLIEHSTASYGQGASPVLAGGKVLVHYADLVALNAKNGAEAWRLKLPPNHGTSIAVTIGGEEAIVHPNGVLVRVSDGKIMADKMGSSGPNSPILHEGIAYFFRGDGRASRLPKDLSAPSKAEDLWKARFKGSGYWFASPILHEGLLYGLSAQGILNVVEADTGKLVYEQRLEFEKGEVYPCVTLAGGLLFISSESGATVIVEPGRTYKELARNSLETFRSTPVFEGRRMYVRTLKNLYCIGE